MASEDRIGVLDHGLIESALVFPGLVAADEQHGPSLRIEGEQRAVDMGAGGRPQFLHIAVLRTLAVVDQGTPELRPRHAQDLQVDGDRLPALGRQAGEPDLELWRDDDDPGHGSIITWMLYGQPSSVRSFRSADTGISGMAWYATLRSVGTRRA